MTDGDTVRLKEMDVAIVGGGAAGLATAIFAGRRMPAASVAVLDGARKLGAKILVAGGGRCNVTNRRVDATDFNGGSRNAIKRVLQAFSAEAAAAFFAEIGVALHEEECGKLFPDSNRAQTVLDALLAETQRRGARILTGRRVSRIARANDGFHIWLVEDDSPAFTARRVVLATGGKSLPKTGSDGGGYALAEALGHSLVAPTPALDPLVLDGEFHASLSGIAQEAELVVRVEGEKPVHVRGPLLWTHFGVSGPAALDASRHWHRARVAGRGVSVAASFLPGADFAAGEQRLRALTADQPKVQLHNALARLLPGRVADAILVELGISHSVPMAHFARDVRRKLVHALIEWPLPVRDGRGYKFAEATAGGVPLGEMDPRTMASRVCPGLYLVGEMLDVDGRIGGFNFQWAWSSGYVAGNAVVAPDASVKACGL